MSEVVPGLFVSEYVPAGAVYEFRRGFIPGVAGGAIAISTKTWDILSPAQQEEVRDMLVRRHAHDGLSKLEGFLDQSNQGGLYG